MQMRNSLRLSLALLLLVAGSTALAEGRGQGLNRALAAASRGSSSSGLARAGQSAARSQNGLARGGASLGRSANGLNRASNGLSHSQSLAAQTTNAARIRDKRLQQAHHLRNISERNGNERLLDTADRMQESAERNYDRGVGERATGDIDVETTAAARVEAPKKPRSTSWLPAWMRSTP